MHDARFSTNASIHTFTVGGLLSQWAETVGLRLEEIIGSEKQSYAQIELSLADPDRQKELLLQDEEEDFLDEGNESNIDSLAARR